MPDDQTASFAPDEPGPKKAGGTRAADWRTDTPGAAGNRNVLAVVSLLTLLAIAGVLIGVLIFWFRSKPKPRFVSIPVGEYNHPAWPVNPWANEDAARLAECFPDGRSNVEFEFQEQKKIRELFDALAIRDADSSRPLVLHITALAAVRGREVYLLPGKAQPEDDPNNWIAVEELLKRFDQAAADHGKLLVLDLAHPVADPFSGVLRNEVSDRLHELLAPRSATLSFPVLTACGPGEESLPADAEQCSGFALYLSEGLSGAADGYVAGQGRDRIVTPPELAAFLSARVGRWARMVHGRKQVPRLYGPTDRGPVFRVPTSLPAPAAQSAPDPYPKWLADGWQLRADQRKTGADLALPIEFARLTTALERAEQAWLRSRDAGRIERSWAETRGSWQTALKEAGRMDRAADVFNQALAAVGKYRLAAARRVRNRPDAPDDWKPALDQYLAAKPPTGKDKPDESRMFLDEWFKKVQPEKGEENRLDAAWLLWDRFRLSPPTVARSRAAVAALDAIAARDAMKTDRRFAETVLLRSLAAWDYRSQIISAYPEEQAQELLRAENELTQVLALGPDGFGLVRPQLDAALKSYQAGQMGFFTGSSQAGIQLKDAADGFANARLALDPWHQAGQELNAAVAALIDAMPSALTAPRGEFDNWLATVEVVTELANAVAPVGKDQSLNPAQLKEALAKKRTVSIVDPFAVPPGKKEPAPLEPRTKPEDVARLARLAAATALPADSRRKMWDTIRADTRVFHEAARKRDADDDAAGVPTTNPAEADGKEFVGENELATRRARVSVALLKLAGYAKADDLSTAVRRLELDPASDAEPLGGMLRKAWPEELPAQATATGRPHEADRIARATPPGAAYMWPPTLAAEPTAARAVASAYRTWVRDQLLADQKLRPKAAGTAEFYETLRKDLDLGPR